MKKGGDIFQSIMHRVNNQKVDDFPFRFPNLQCVCTWEDPLGLFLIKKIINLSYSFVEINKVTL